MIAALIHLWKKNQAEASSLDDQEEISVSQENDLADSEDLENDLAEPTDDTLDDETDNKMETKVSLKDVISTVFPSTVTVHPVS